MEFITQKEENASNFIRNVRFAHTCTLLAYYHPYKLKKASCKEAFLFDNNKSYTLNYHNKKAS